jgi:hypothetical protein
LGARHQSSVFSQAQQLNIPEKRNFALYQCQDGTGDVWEAVFSMCKVEFKNAYGIAVKPFGNGQKGIEMGRLT